MNVLYNPFTGIGLAEKCQSLAQEAPPMLLEIIRLFRQTVTIELAKDSFRQGWQEAMQGEALPISDLWGVLMLNDETSDFGEVMDDRADYG